MFPEWTWIVGFFIGASIGSFLNVVIYRMPRGISLYKPAHSFCPSCKHPLGPADLMPLFSWLISRGTCRYCGEKVASRYFWVEVVTGTLWAAVWWQYLVANSQWIEAIFFSLAVSTAVAITYIDFDVYMIPDELNALLLVFGLAMGAILGQFHTAVIGAVVGWGALWGCAVLARVAFGKDGMGHGDIKMMRGMGALIGPVLTVVSVGIAVIVGLIVGVAGIIAATRAKQGVQDVDEEFLPPESIASLFKLGIFYLVCGDIFALFFPKLYKMIGESESEVLPEDDDWKPGLTTIPFGPYLAIGCVICMLFSKPLSTKVADWWHKQTGEVSISRPNPLSGGTKTVYRMAGRRVFVRRTRDVAHGGEIEEYVPKGLQPSGLEHRRF